MKRYSQPQGGAQIDWGNLITRGLCVVSVPNGGSVLNVSPFNVEKTATKFGSIPSVVTRQKGLGAFAGLDNTNAWRLHSVANQTTTAFEKPSSEITVLAFIERFGNNASGNAFIFGNTTTSASPYVAWALYDHAGAGVLSFEISTSGATRTLDTGTSMPTVPTVLVGTYNGATQTAYMGGKVVGTPVSVTGSITYPSAADRGPAIGNFWEFTALNRSFNGAVYLAALWDRALSDAEIKSISDNPWQLFRAANAPIFVPVSGGGGSPYTLTADAGALAITGNAAGLSVNRTLTAGAGALSITGNAATLAFNRALIADTANVAITGNAASLVFTPVGGPTYTLPADSASIAISSAATSLVRGYNLALDAGAVSISASDAALIATRKLIADAYAAVIAGYDATLTYTPIVYPTIGRPASDTSNSGWTASTGSDLFAMVDEVTPDALDYIVTTATGSVCELALEQTAYPGTASQALKYRASSSTGNSLIVRLKNGATTIRTETQALTASDTEYTITLTSGEIAAITSGSLSVELESA